MQKPNIVIIMTDQQRADLSKREGFSLDTTPFLDSMAQRGVWFDHAYTTMPICGPARVSMLTGRYPSASRVRTNWNIEDAFYKEDLFDIFRRHGYKTGLCGKNHSHLKPEKTDFWFAGEHLGIFGDSLSEQEKAFNEFLKETHFHVSMNPTPFPLECQIPYRLVSRATQWIESLGNQAFLLWLSIPEPHNPYQVPEPYFSMFEADYPPPDTDKTALEIKGFKYQFCRESFIKAFPDYERQIRRARLNYLGMLRLIDDQLRRFVQFMEEKKLMENTIVIFLSDHGDLVGEYGLLRKGPELPEPIIRIPLQFYGAGIKAREEAHPAHVSIVDLTPTLCEAIGEPLGEGVQGRSILPVLRGEDYPEKEFSSSYVEQGFGGLHYAEKESLDQEKDGLEISRDGKPGAFDCLNSWTQSGTMRMVRKGDWKLIMDMMGKGQLYNLRDDPHEIRNLYDAPEYVEKRSELLEKLAAWMLRVQDPLPLPHKRYVMKRDARNYWNS
ncbi:sulfatase-like hydrolase/transferase [Candidatus Sumerlaeota bacterium]|nr:sulfatase-like hydrolase/transferase [Candidatus Sumerlaeota bacterium]